MLLLGMHQGPGWWVSMKEGIDRVGVAGGGFLARFGG